MNTDSQNPALPCSCWAVLTLSSTVIRAKRRMFWKVRAMPSVVDLVRILAGDVLAAQCDRAGGRGQKSGDNVEQGRLAGAVGTDDAEDFSSAELQVVVGEGLQSPETPAEVHRFEDHVASFAGHPAPQPPVTRSLLTAERRLGRPLPGARRVGHTRRVSRR